MVDNFITVTREFLSQNLSNSSLGIVTANLADVDICKDTVARWGAVFHV